MVFYKLQFDIYFTLFFLLFLTQQPLSHMQIGYYLVSVLLYLSAALLIECLAKPFYWKITLLVIILFSAGLALPYLYFFAPFPLLSLILEKEVQRLRGTLLYLLLANSCVFFLPNFTERLAYVFLTVILALFYHLLGRGYHLMKAKEEANEALKRHMEELSQKVEQQKAQFLRETQLAKLEERNHLSHQIHDQLGHALTGGLIQLEAAQAILYKDPEKASELLGNAIVINKNGIDSIRKTLQATKPAQESIAISQMKAKLEEFENDYQIRTVFHYEGDLRRVTQAMWYVCYHNLNEALTNVLKYSKATRVNIQLTVLNKIVRFKIQDNGLGTAHFEKHLGIIGMEERTSKLGGNLVIDTRSGFGIVTLLPTEETTS